MEVELSDEQQTALVAEQLATAITKCSSGLFTLYLQGDLGAGKTTFSRYLIQALGHTGSVKSPTFTLCEPYQLDTITVFHFDLYRLNEPEELEYLGFRDYLNTNTLLLVEWPQKGGNLVAQPDLWLELRHGSTSLPNQRMLTVKLGERQPNQAQQALYAFAGSLA